MTTAPAPGGPDDATDDRLQLILDAFTSVASEEDEDGALERAVDVARLATRAVFGAAVLLGADGAIATLVHEGMTSRQVASLPGPPRGVGVLGRALTGESLRLDRLADHPSAVGLPSVHPLMAAFLGVPVTSAEGTVLGALYLSKPPGHPPFTEADEALVSALAHQVGAVVVRLRAARQVEALAVRLAAAERVRGAALARMTSGMDPVEALDLLLDAVREQLAMPLAALVRLEPDASELQRARGTMPGLPLLVGARAEGEVLCHRMLAGQISAVPDVRGRADLLGLAPGAVGAYVGVPLTVDGQVHGSLCVFAGEPTPVGEPDVAALGVLADLVSHQLSRLAADAAVRTRREEQLAAALSPDGLSIVLQPVVSLSDGRVVAVEALARFPTLGLRPDVVFAEAASLGHGVQAELVALRAALALLPSLPDGVDLTANVGPATMLDPEVLTVLGGTDAGRVVLELTEHEDLGEHPGLVEAVHQVRATGARVAIDDAGAGYSGLRSIVDVAPDVLKLDIALVRGIDADPARRSLVRALVALAQDLGAVLVAEGVETAAELDELRRLGVRKAQGYFLGRPAAPAEVDLGRRTLAALPAQRPAQHHPLPASW
ncbi:EAL domain-containing protein [Pseudokineococcus sp. 1T1Z-3]|uniref:EAL domain-containing protein n=1 Tax=Pseudokineococcus sp. 1T1Z-3 TaxID=3132745 RepID=UPI0030AF60D3